MCCLVSTRPNNQTPSGPCHNRQAGSLQQPAGVIGHLQGSGRGHKGIRQGSQRGQQESAGSYPSNLPANPDHEGSKKVAWQVLYDGEGSHKDGQHEEGHNEAIDAGVDSRPHGEDGLTKDVAAGEASTRNASCHV